MDENFSVSKIWLPLGAVFLRLLPHYLLGMACRPLWRIWLQAEISRAEKYKTDPKRVEHALIARCHLLYEGRSAWPQVEPWLDQMDHLRLRISLSKAFAMLYLYNQRFSEAETAATYWLSIATGWMEENLAKTRQALALYRKIYGWFLLPKQRDRWKPLSREQQMQALIILGDLKTNNMLKEYRESRIALAIVHWLQNEEEQGRLESNFKIREKDLNPFFPFTSPFDFKLAERFGMTRQVFDNITIEAEKIELPNIEEPPKIDLKTTDNC